MVNSGSSIVAGIEKTQAGVGLHSGVASSAMIAAMVAIALGVGMIFAVGFSHSDLLHAAAHDVRHAAGFPCH
jgi:cobalt transporter subunit CbtB